MSNSEIVPVESPLMAEEVSAFLEGMIEELPQMAVEIDDSAFERKVQRVGLALILTGIAIPILIEAITHIAFPG